DGTGDARHAVLPTELHQTGRGSDHDLTVRRHHNCRDGRAVDGRGKLGRRQPDRTRWPAFDACLTGPLGRHEPADHADDRRQQRNRQQPDAAGARWSLRRCGHRYSYCTGGKADVAGVLRLSSTVRSACVSTQASWKFQSQKSPFGLAVVAKPSAGPTLIVFRFPSTTTPSWSRHRYVLRAVDAVTTKVSVSPFASVKPNGAPEFDS